MIHIVKQEFLDAFKSIRSILIILFITYISYQSASILRDNPLLVQEFVDLGGDESAVYTIASALVVLVFGFLFAFAISHDVINKEVELKTIRLLVTKQSRWQVVLGKFLGIFLFWAVVISVSFLIMTIIAGKWFTKDYVTALLLVFYMTSFVLLISTLIPKSKLTMFLGILFGIMLPIIGINAMFSDKWYMLLFKYILPYKYVAESAGWLVIPFVIGLVYIAISILWMKRKDL